jgi:hypothetical protein
MLFDRAGDSPKSSTRVHGLEGFASGSTLLPPQARFAGASRKAIYLLLPRLTGKIRELNSRFAFFTARGAGQAAVFMAVV